MLKDLDCELFYSEPKRHNVSQALYYYSAYTPTSGENDNTVLIKGLKRL